MKVERSYGGKPGIWLKKRTRASVAPSCSKQPSQLQSITLIPEDNDSATDSKDDSCTDKNVTSSKLKIIGWDDALCRPIYQGAVDPPTDTDDADAKYKTTGEENELTDIEENRMDDTMIKKQSEGNGKRSNRRSKYGSRKRSMVDLSGTEQGNGLDIPLPKKQIMEASNSRRVSNGSPNRETSASTAAAVCPSSELKDPFTVASPFPVTHSICLTLNSETKKITLSGTGTGDVDFSNTCRTSHITKEVLVNDVSPNSEAINDPTKQPPASRRPKQELTGTVFEFVDEPVHQQPSSTTSVNAAKAFFARLDTTQKLVIDGSNSPQMPGQRCVRTTRTTNMANPTLKDEYDRYSAASIESGVKPLSIKEYAVNRGTYFRTSDMFDGFLDD